jgi:hypothetical protein
VPDPLSAPPPPPSTQALTGNLQVAVSGAEAKVFLDAEFRGVARPGQPLNLTGLIPGEAKLRLESPGFLPARQPVQIEAGKWQQVALPMRRGWNLTIYRKPNLFQWNGTDFEVFIDDKKRAKVGNKDFVTLTIPAGDHTLRILNTSDDMILGVLDAKLRLEDSPKASRFFRINAGMSIVLSEVSEETWKIESARFGSREVGGLE